MRKKDLRIDSDILRRAPVLSTYENIDKEAFQSFQSSDALRKSPVDGDAWLLCTFEEDFLAEAYSFGRQVPTKKWIIKYPSLEKVFRLERYRVLIHAASSNNYFAGSLQQGGYWWEDSSNHCVVNKR
jgi:hypothetical protein